MTIEHNADLVKEWQELHSSHESYEHFALVIKLFTVTLTILLILFTQPSGVILLVLAVLWQQEGIWKTFQARTSTRIELIEQALVDIKHGDESSTIAFQFYRQWSENRVGSVPLIKEYLQNSLKPTVIFPYVPLMLITLVT